MKNMNKMGEKGWKWYEQERMKQNMKEWDRIFRNYSFFCVLNKNM